MGIGVSFYKMIKSRVVTYNTYETVWTVWVNVIRGYHIDDKLSSMACSVNFPEIVSLSQREHLKNKKERRAT